MQTPSQNSVPRRCPKCGLTNPHSTQRCDCGNPLTEPFSPEEQPIGVWSRLTSEFYDGLILLAASLVGSTAINASSGFLVLSASIPWWLDAFILALYQIASYVRSGQTIGKKITKIRILREDGGTLTVGDALRRSSVTLIIGVIHLARDLAGSGGGMLGLLFVYWIAANIVVIVATAGKRSIQDEVARTKATRSA